nr:hypothetical protein [Ophiocordyceps lanpingensis]
MRRCAAFIHEIKDFIQCPYLYPTSELGEGENPTLNLAFPLKWLIKLIQLNWLVTRVAFPMIKAKLLEVYLKGSSTIGNYLDWYRVIGINDVFLLCASLWAVHILGITNTYKSESWQSKGNWRMNSRTTGLPKVPKDYGNRRIIVPFGLKYGQSIGLKGPVALGRILDQQYCSYSSSAGDSSSVKSVAIRRLQWLENKCRENKEFVVSDLYQLMFNTKLFEIAYNNLKSKPGNMTPGIVPTTLDGFSIEVIQNLIEKLKDESFKFSPGKRVMIPKGGERPLTVAPPRDKIVQEVMRMILAAVFESSFSPNSHGFRPGKSCHSALRQVYSYFGVATWYIEGDISKCFDSFDHDILMNIIGLRIKDGRFLSLIRKALRAGYFEFGVYKHSIVGTPQGSIISPILSNIYLNEFDKFVESLCQSFSNGTKARTNPTWISYTNKKRRAKSILEKIKWNKLILATPSKDPLDPNFKKLVFVRYADDWILGVRGSHEDCEFLLAKVKTFLKESLNLDLSVKKTLITNANKDKALFLGTKIFRSRHQLFKWTHGFASRVGKEIRMEIALSRVFKKLEEAKFVKDGESYPRYLWMHNSKDQIVALYNSVYRGITNYYSFAHNLGKVSGYIHMILKSSCAKLLAAKFSEKSQQKIFIKFGKDLKGPDNIAFAKATYINQPWNFKMANKINSRAGTSDLGMIKTLYAESISIASLEDLKCSVCESNYRVEMHHVRMMKDLNPKLNKIDALMVKRRRKQIPLCRVCHMKHHSKSIL